MTETISAQLVNHSKQQNWQAIADAMPYVKHLGLIVTATKQRELLIELPWREDLVGNVTLPAIHGGVLGGLMEAAAILQVVADERCARLPKIIDFTASYLRPAAANSTFARCEVLRLGKRTAVANVRLWQEDPNKLVSSGQVHLLLQELGTTD